MSVGPAQLHAVHVAAGAVLLCEDGAAVHTSTFIIIPGPVPPDDLVHLVKQVTWQPL
jgi:hypothetical protein